MCERADCRISCTVGTTSDVTEAYIEDAELFYGSMCSVEPEESDLECYNGWKSTNSGLNQDRKNTSSKRYGHMSGQNFAISLVLNCNLCPIFALRSCCLLSISVL